MWIFRKEQLRDLREELPRLDVKSEGGKKSEEKS